MILGLGGSGHDWSSAVITDDRVFALDEERTSRRKYGLGADLISAGARRKVLRAAGGGRPDHVVACSLVPDVYKKSTRLAVEVIDHHLAHAYGAFYTSGFADATVVIVDNAGSVLARRGDVYVVETVSVYRADDRGLELVGRVEGEHRLDAERYHDSAGETTNSLGAFYREVSLQLGLSFFPEDAPSPMSEDGKTMGLASYGDDALEDMFDHCFTGEGLALRIDPACVTRALEAQLQDRSFASRARVAAAAQRRLERSLLEIVADASRLTESHNLCMAGGVALNSVANGRILRESDFDQIHVMPAAADNGISLGAAIYGALHLEGRPRDDLPIPDHTYLGPPPAPAEVEAAVAGAALERLAVDDPVEFVADRLADGAVVGWYEGGAEFGPRALGHRSILSSPLSPLRRDHLNRFIKKREWFRPYAPIVTAETSAKHFELSQESPYMLLVAPVIGDDLPAITHVDGTARLQTVREDQCASIHALLRAFGSLTGKEVLLNTSFNAAGEPIVETPAEAIASYEAMGLDYLYIEGEVLARPGRSAA